MDDARTWADEHAPALIGLPADRAVEIVVDAGLRARTAQPDSALTMEYRADRVTLLLDGRGAVSAVRPG